MVCGWRDGCSLIFGDYMVPGADPKLYEEVKDMAALVPTIEEYLSDYNAGQWVALASGRPPSI